MENATKYNGWTNYATWRVHLELFDGLYNDCELFDIAASAFDLGNELKDYAENAIESTSDEGLARDYALAFLSDVNWFEIARHMRDSYTEETNV